MRTKEQDAIRKRIEYWKEKDKDNAILAAIESRRTNWTREKYAEFLQSFYWDDIFTITFRDPRTEPYYAAKSIWRELSGYNPDRDPVSYGVTRAFIAIEPFQSGDLHAHGLISGNIRGWLPEMKLPWEIWGGVFNKFGRSKVEAIRSPENVSMYCAKYILKQQSRVCDYYNFMGDTFSWKNGLLN